MLRTPIVGILGFFEVLSMAGGFTGDGVTGFLLTTVTKSPSEEFSPVTKDD
jgi:hypothetical protein